MLEPMMKPAAVLSAFVLLMSILIKVSAPAVVGPVEECREGYIIDVIVSSLEVDQNWNVVTRHGPETAEWLVDVLYDDGGRGLFNIGRGALGEARFYELDRGARIVCNVEAAPVY